MNLIKVLLLFILTFSLTLLAQESEMNEDEFMEMDTPSTTSEKIVKYQVFAAYQVMNIDKVNYQGKFFHPDSVNKMRGVTFGPGFEFKILDFLSTTTRPSVTLLKSNDLTRSSVLEIIDNDYSYYSLGLTQTINYDYVLNTAIIQPNLQFGLGYSRFQADNQSKVSSAHTKEKFDGFLYEVAAGVNIKMIDSGIIPFMKVSYQVNDISTFRWDSGASSGSDNNIKGASYKSYAVLAGVGYQF